MEDGKIVELYFARDEQAIPETAAKYGNYCTAIAKNILGSPEDAEECVNDTYLNTWNAIPPHRPTILSTFLGKITRNLAFNRYKYNTAEKRGGSQLPVVLEELSGCVSGKEDVAQVYERKELAAAINVFLKSQSAKKRDIFIRRYWYTDSLEEIARRYHMSDHAVSMTLSRLRTSLRAYLVVRGYHL